MAYSFPHSEHYQHYRTSNDDIRVPLIAYTKVKIINLCGTCKWSNDDFFNSCCCKNLRANYLSVFVLIDGDRKPKDTIYHVYHKRTIDILTDEFDLQTHWQRPDTVSFTIRAGKMESGIYEIVKRWILPTFQQSSETGVNLETTVFTGARNLHYPLRSYGQMFRQLVESPFD